MVRMPDEESKNPLAKLSSLLKKKPDGAGDSDCECEEKETDAQQEEEKIKEIIKRKVVKY